MRRLMRKAEHPCVSTSMGHTVCVCVWERESERERVCVASNTRCITGFRQRSEVCIVQNGKKKSDVSERSS